MQDQKTSSNLYYLFTIIVQTDIQFNFKNQTLILEHTVFITSYSLPTYVPKYLFLGF